jgi:hypothetical protein
MVWKPFRFRHQSRWTPRRNNLRRNKKPGNSGFFIACDLVFYAFRALASAALAARKRRTSFGSASNGR